MRLQISEPNEWDENLVPPAAVAAAAAAQAVTQRPKTSRKPAGPKPIPEDTNEDNSVISVSTTLKPPLKTPKTPWSNAGAFATACELYPTLDGRAEAIRIHSAYHHLYDRNHLSMPTRASLISMHPAPFPMLTSNKSTNTALFLHCITVFHPALGSASWQHPATGSIIAFMGDMMQYGHPPLVVTIPTNAFDHAKPWTNACRQNFSGSATWNLRSDPSRFRTHNQHRKNYPDSSAPSKLFRQPPLYPIYPTFQKFLSAFSTTQPTAQSSCEITLRFLRTAIARSSDPYDPSSLLAFDFAPLPLDQEIGQWAISRYVIYKAVANNNNDKKLPVSNRKQPPKCNKHESPERHLSNTEQAPPTQFIQQTPTLQQATAHVPNIDTTLNQSPPHFNVHRITMNYTFQPSPMPQAQQTQTNHPYLLPLPTYRNNRKSKTLPPPNYISEPHFAQQNRMLNNIVQMDEALFAQMISTAITTSLREGYCPARNQPTTLDEAIPERTIKMKEQTKLKLQVLAGLIEGVERTPSWQDLTSERMKATRYRVLYQYLEEAQKQDSRIQFTLRQDTVNDFAILKFNHPMSVDAMNQGVSPCTLEKLTAEEKYEINDQEESREQATHITMKDVAKKRKKGTRQPISDLSYSPEFMATFRALILILSGTMSPLFMDTDELCSICLYGHRRQIFQATRTKRPGWFAHLLWFLYIKTRKFLKTTVAAIDFQNQIQFPCPIEYMILHIRLFGPFPPNDTPKDILPRLACQYKTKHQTMTETEPQTKKQKNTANSGHRQLLPEPIFQLKNAATKKMPRITILRALREGGSDIPKLSKATGVLEFTCCRLPFWGMCNDSNCKLKHDPITLSKEAIDKAVASSKPGCDKISMQTLNNGLRQEEKANPNPNKTTQTSKPTRQTNDNPNTQTARTTQMEKSNARVTKCSRRQQSRTNRRIHATTKNTTKTNTDTATGNEPIRPNKSLIQDPGTKLRTIMVFRTVTSNN